MGWLSGLACGLVLAASAQVQERTEIRTRADGATEVRRISTVIGSPVQLQDGDRYGQVEDIVIGPSGCVEYVVIGYEDRFVVVPWSIATVQWADRAVVLDTRPQLLERVTFTRNDWERMNFRELNRTVGGVFDTGSIRQRREAREGVREEAIERERDDADRPRREADRPRAEPGRAEDRSDDDRETRPADRPRDRGDDRRPAAEDRRPAVKDQDRPNAPRREGDRPQSETDRPKDRPRDGDRKPGR